MNIINPIIHITVVIALAIGGTVAAVRADEQHQKQSEIQLAKAWCDDADGFTEFRLPDATRVDCLLDDYAVEMDWSEKWAECIGQAQFYGAMTDRRPACVLIRKGTTPARLFQIHNRRAAIAADKYTLIICISDTGIEIKCENNRGRN